jgi:hypothetical protein
VRIAGVGDEIDVARGRRRDPLDGDCEWNHEGAFDL